MPFTLPVAAETVLDSAPALAGNPLQRSVESVLDSLPHVPRRLLRFEVADGRVTLHGRVRSFFHKQMVQEALRPIHGIKMIENNLEVVWV